jgi:SAM-dependent methyltransferase
LRTEIDNNVKTGRLDHCQICGSRNLELVIDCGHQPLCDSLVPQSRLSEPETYFPLRQFRCPDCTNNQLDYIVDGSTVYHPEYPYRTGVTKELSSYQFAIADELTARYGLGSKSLVVDIGSNDGTLLKGFQKNGVAVVGVEPTDIALIARKDGVETVQAFFDENTAKQISSGHGRAAVITASNVFAHMAPLGDVVRGIRDLLADDGVFVLENHYLVDVLLKAQYDTIYHEHIRTYSLKSLVTLFGFYGMTIFHAERVSRYGGNIRAHVCKDGRPASASVGEILKMEAELGLGDDKIYAEFRRKSFESRLALQTLAVNAAREGKSFVGNSFPGRANTLLHFCGIGIDLMPYIAEQAHSLKLGLYAPGKHIPIVNNQRLIDEQPDYVVLLAWHYAQPIAEQLRARGLKSKLIQPLPECRVLDI